MLEAVGISQLPLGVVNTTGMCDQRAVAVDDGIPVYGRADRAYRLTQRAVLTVSTAQVFQGKSSVFKEKLWPISFGFFSEGFPDDLSIVATLRPAQGVNSVLFAVYNDAGDEQLVVSVGKTVSITYQEGDDEGNRSPPLQVDFGVRMNDGKSVRQIQLPVALDTK